MKIGFIGAGKVGFTLGKYFAEQGLSVTGYFSRSINSAREAAAFTGTACFETLDSILSVSDVLFLTVPDSVIGEVWRCIKTRGIQHKIVCHCSGLIPSSVFDGIQALNAFGYSVHPLWAVGSKTASYKEMGQVIFTLEGSEKQLPTVKRLLEQRGNRVFVISARQKARYHSAAVFLSNFVNALANVGCKLLTDCGFEDAFTKAVLNTLFLGNCKAVAENGPAASLTGPVARNDITTLKKHIACLHENEKRLYLLLSKYLAEIAEEKHSDTDYADLKQFLTNTWEGLK